MKKVKKLKKLKGIRLGEVVLKGNILLGWPAADYDASRDVRIMMAGQDMQMVISELDRQLHSLQKWGSCEYSGEDLNRLKDIVKEPGLMSEPEPPTKLEERRIAGIAIDAMRNLLWQIIEEYGVTKLVNE